METKYINPFIDYGFKKLFVTEANKDILISFLNAVIEDSADPIVDLTYKNIELIGEFNGARDSYLDAYCETASGRQFIVEMQNSWQPFFKDRTLYYAAKAITNQAVKDDPTKREQPEKEELKKAEKWNYRLKEVFVIALMNFNFPKKEYKPEDYYHRIMLTDLNDQHVFYDKLTLIYLEMRKVGKAKLDMNRPLDRWLMVLYKLWGEEDCPPELEEPIFKKLYKEAEFARFNSDQQLTYERSWKRELDIYNEIEGGRILGHEEGLEEGRKEGREEGLAEGKELGIAEGENNKALEIARNMKALGLDDETIMKATGLVDINR